MLFFDNVTILLPWWLQLLSEALIVFSSCVSNTPHLKGKNSYIMLGSECGDREVILVSIL